MFTVHRGGQFNGYARFSGEKSDEKCPDITNVGPSLGSLYKVSLVQSSSSDDDDDDDDYIIIPFNAKQIFSRNFFF